jgi:SAM-dependent methyltransferase
VTAPAPASDSETILVLHLRPSRARARDVAVAEVAGLLRDLGGRPVPGGPLSEHRGVAWAAVATRHVETAARRLSRLGYTGAVDLVRPPDEAAAGEARRTVRWRRTDMALQRVYEEADEALRSAAPDRRTFLLECGDGVVRPIAGYRGGRGPLEHRALPVEDARLLVNLVAAPARGRLLEPFGGAGGVVIEARASGWTVVSVDRDPTLRFGLRALADLHVVGDAAALPVRTASVDAVATEPPHHPGALALVAASIGEMARVLRPGGRMAVLLAAHQAEAVRRAAAALDLTPEVDAAIDRKGTEAHCLSWLRAG